ncbi:hypothetical protein [Bradyrhizobium arachidis]|uniref:Uncharacterized protein n=1 Tax=Bradyrhizobium arachidis TaxID=858423 RepID=A0AAE7NZ21_9BRAD|nr:hypothetical protein [Bradyrhizobium arachidis]QOZ71494.1 hypothetical protein WN72_38285 [Bradyrhizobium arachidis]SFU52259.1 hypothetical protein SAMN05192541_102441 [Bradyrhizobium arachidis]
MLPGFRFLLAAILLSTSILVFGLGAAALLRATHEQYVSNPSWRNGPQEKVFAQASEPTQPVLAVLRAEPEAAAEPTPSLRDQVPTIGLPEQMAALTSETDAQPQVVAPPADAAPAEPAKVEATIETKIETTAEAAAPADTLTPADTTATIPEATPAIVATASAPAPVDAAVDPSRAMAAAALDVATTRLAALNDPAAAKAAPAKAKSDTSKPESKATKPKAKKRHREVRRPPPQQLRQQFDPFGQQTFATTTTRTR